MFGISEAGSILVAQKILRMSINLEVQWARLAKSDVYKDIVKEDGDDDARKDNLSQIMHLQGFCKAIREGWHLQK